MTDYKEVITAMREYATQLDKFGYKARKKGIDYKAREYFDAAIKLRIAADAFEYCMS
jgi:hypothetical protein